MLKNVDSFSRFFYTVYSLIFILFPLCFTNRSGGDDQDEYEETQRMLDHSIIQLQNTLLKIYQTFDDVITDFAQYTDELAYESQKLLAHEHIWVRLK